MYQLTGLKPLVLKAKEGLALINGTQFIAAHAAIGVYRMQQLLDISDIIGAMSLEGVLGSASPFSKKIASDTTFYWMQTRCSSHAGITGTFRNDTITH